MKTKLIRITLVFLFALLLEFFVFNFPFFFSKIDKTNEYNVHYSINDISKANWIESDEKLVSLLDPHLIMEDICIYVKDVDIIYDAEAPVDSIILFYTNDTTKYFDGDNIIVKDNLDKNHVTIEVGQYVKDLRIDLGESPDLILYDINVLINPINIHFSISRVIAVLLIYLIATALFGLQKNPEYYIDNQND